MTSKNEIYSWMNSKYLTQGHAEELAVVAIEEGISASRDDRGAVHSQAELIRVKRKILAQADASAMRHFDDIAKSQPVQVCEHAARRHLGHDHGRIGAEEFFQGWSVKMVPMEMR